MSSCPCCGLTQEKVLLVADKYNLPLIGGKCQNPLADGTDRVCGKALGAHPTQEARRYEDRIEVAVVDFRTKERKSLIYSKNGTFAQFRSGVYRKFLLSDFNFKLYELKPNDSTNKTELCSSNYHERQLVAYYVGGFQVYGTTTDWAKLTHSPAFNTVVGNLQTVSSLVETNLMQRAANGSFGRKEDLPFICIINPPRHGKSLLLDTLFKTSDDVLVISITYNNNTSFTSEELNSVDTALSYFWLRVLKSLVNHNSSLNELFITCSRDNINPNLQYIRNQATQTLKPDPFHTKNGLEKHVLLAVDEFSLLTDLATSIWTPQQQKDFISKLHNVKSVGSVGESKPFFQFVFTGFNRGMTDILQSSAVVETYTIKLCSFTSSKLLLKHIYNCYNEKKINSMPVGLFEVIKSVPGLVGEWAHRVKKENKFDDSITSFHKGIIWLERIIDSKNRRNNWILLLKYLLFLEKSSSQNIELKKIKLDQLGVELVKAEIGVYGDDIVFNPVCFALLVLNVTVDDCKSCGVGKNDEWVEKLLPVLQKTVGVSEATKAGINKNGEDFEQFVMLCLEVRLMLMFELFGDSKMQLKTTEQWLLPGVVFEGKINSLEIESLVLFHSITKSTELTQLLLTPLYHIFPVGLESLKESKFSLDNITDGVERWMKSVGNQVYDLIPCDQLNNNVINVGCRVVHHVKLGVVMPRNQPGGKKDVAKISEKQAKQLMLLIKNKLIQQEIDFFEMKVSTQEVSSMMINLEVSDLDEEDGSSDEIVKWWYKISGLCRSLWKVISEKPEVSFFGTSKGAEGCDFIGIWHENPVAAQEESLTLGDGIVASSSHLVTPLPKLHIAAIELKDRLFTANTEWTKKAESLTGHRSALRWIQIFMSKFEVVLHIVFAGLIVTAHQQNSQHHQSNGNSALQAVSNSNIESNIQSDNIGITSSEHSNEVLIQETTVSMQERLDTIVRAFSHLPPDELARFNIDLSIPIKEGSQEASNLVEAWQLRQSELKEAMKNQLKPAEYMTNIINKLSPWENNNNSELLSIDEKYQLFHDLESVLTDIDIARDFHTIGGWKLFHSLLQQYSSKDESVSDQDKRMVVTMSAWCIGTAVKNSYDYQLWTLEDNILLSLIHILHNETNYYNNHYNNHYNNDSNEMSKRVLYAISSAVRGNVDVQSF
eukprot:gene9566-12884_t